MFTFLQYICTCNRKIQLTKTFCKLNFIYLLFPPPAAGGGGGGGEAMVSSFGRWPAAPLLPLPSPLAAFWRSGWPVLGGWGPCWWCFSPARRHPVLLHAVMNCSIAVHNVLGRRQFCKLKMN